MDITKEKLLELGFTPDKDNGVFATYELKTKNGFVFNACLDESEIDMSVCRGNIELIYNKLFIDFNELKKYIESYRNFTPEIISRTIQIETQGPTDKSEIETRLDDYLSEIQDWFDDDEIPKVQVRIFGENGLITQFEQ